MEIILIVLFAVVIWLVCRAHVNRSRSLNGQDLHSKNRSNRARVERHPRSQKSPPPPPLRVNKADHLVGRETCFIAVVDTESTGLSAEDEPISLGIILFEVNVKTGNKVAELGRYYGEREPGVPINPRAAEVNGMTIARLRGKRLNQESISKLLDKADILVAHNAKFDYRMVFQIYEQSALKIWGCSIQSLKFHWSGYPNRKLDTLCEEFNIERRQPHNALSDCEALAELLFKRTGKTDRSSTFMGALLRNPWISR